MEIDGDLEVPLVPEASRRVLHPLDLGVDGFTEGIGDGVMEVGDEVHGARLPEQAELPDRHLFPLRPSGSGAMMIPTKKPEEPIFQSSMHLGCRKRLRSRWNHCSRLAASPARLGVPPGLPSR